MSACLDWTKIFSSPALSCDVQHNRLLTWCHSASQGPTPSSQNQSFPLQWGFRVRVRAGWWSPPTSNRTQVPHRDERNPLPFSTHACNHGCTEGNERETLLFSPMDGQWVHLIERLFLKRSKITLQKFHPEQSHMNLILQKIKNKNVFMLDESVLQMSTR